MRSVVPATQVIGRAGLSLWAKLEVLAEVLLIVRSLHGAIEAVEFGNEELSHALLNVRSRALAIPLRIMKRIASIGSLVYSDRSGTSRRSSPLTLA